MAMLRAGRLSVEVEVHGYVVLRDEHGKALSTNCNDLREVVRRMDAWLAGDDSGGDA